MDVGVLSVRYAKALFDYALEKGVEGQVYKELVLVAHSFASNPDLRATLDNPLLPAKEKFQFLHTAAGEVLKPAEEISLAEKSPQNLRSFLTW